MRAYQPPYDEEHLVETSRLPLGDMERIGQPYLIDNGDFREAFAFRIRTNAPGAVADPRPEQPAKFLVAYSPICTHMGCVVLKDEDDVNYIWKNKAEHLTCRPCPCHGTTFDLLRSGLVVLGPATQNLSQLKLEAVGDDVFAVDWLSDVDPRIEKWPV